MALRLSDLRKKIEPVELGDGKEYDVREPDAGAMELLVAYYQMTDDEKVVNIANITAIIKRLIPTAPIELLKELTQTEQGAVIAHATGKLTQVNAELKNE